MAGAKKSGRRTNKGRQLDGTESEVLDGRGRERMVVAEIGHYSKTRCAYLSLTFCPLSSPYTTLFSVRCDVGWLHVCLLVLAHDTRDKRLIV